ncbi:hypothetical protein QFZ20_002163 [Flavobacterium sp. W4I14]|nr:hypothetical protein [Flavobacterium sp. W4I14]
MQIDGCYPDNLGRHLSIDETSLSHGELYTIITNKAAKGRKGAIVAVVAGTKAEVVIAVLNKIPEKERKKVLKLHWIWLGTWNLSLKNVFQWRYGLPIVSMFRN